MKFKDCKFKNKKQVRDTATKRIIKSIKSNVAYNMLNHCRVVDYVHLLIDETDYNIKHDYFYHDLTGFKINILLLEKVAVEYVKEHIDEFIKEALK